MKLFYYRDVVSNFGDELNPWLFSKLIPELLSDDGDLFLGIGSILFDNFPSNVQKIVFGSGYGGYTKPPALDSSWTVYFVRGPRTARALGLEEKFAVGDAATLIRALPDQLPPPGSPIGPIYIPHWESAIDGVWESVARDAGLKYVDPRWSVETVLSHIRSSSLVVTEAMHGAIVADALRVPWIPFMPLLEKHRYKWFDWAESLDLTISFRQSAPSSWNEWAILKLRGGKQAKPKSVTVGENAPPRLSRAREIGASLNGFGGALARYKAVKALTAAAATEPYLSSNATISRVSNRMIDCLAQLRECSRERRPN